LVQLLLQAPQCRGDVSVFVSQPLLERPSQLPKPESQAVRAQVPPLQASEAFARSQTTLQPPQSVSVLMFRSQPVFGLPSQLA
jgi:hypothetical protein